MGILDHREKGFHSLSIFGLKEMKFRLVFWILVKKLKRE